MVVTEPFFVILSGVTFALFKLNRIEVGLTCVAVSDKLSVMVGVGEIPLEFGPGLALERKGCGGKFVDVVICRLSIQQSSHAPPVRAPRPNTPWVGGNAPGKFV